MNYWNKEKDRKKNNLQPNTKRKNWNQNSQSFPSSPRNIANSKIDGKKIKRQKKIRKSLQYLLLLKKFNNIIDYKNIKLLKAFLTKYGKIKARRKTRISVQKQRQIAKSIRKARAYKLIPFVCDVKN